MSSSVDGKVYIWDQFKTGEEQARHDYQDGPPEMIFPHDTHKNSSIEDIAWSTNDDNFAVTCDTDCKMQVWKLSDEFFFNEIDYLDKIENINDNEIE